MSYAIIRNIKYTRSNIMGIYKHNERLNQRYSNKNINHKKTSNNYSIKSCSTSYIKKFDELKESKNLKGWIKTNSNIACEYIITSDENFFKNIGEEETKRFFKTAYDFVKSYKNLGDDYILSANVHMDEATPHMHLVFIPVIHSINKKTGLTETKISCSEFWKGQNSYKLLQDSFYKYITRAGFNLERGDTENNKHINIENLKQITNYEVQQFEKQSVKPEQEINSNDITNIRNDYKRIINKFNSLANQYTKIKVINDNTNSNLEYMKKELLNLKKENEILKVKRNQYINYINKAYECTSILLDLPIDRLQRIINNYAKESEKSESNNTRTTDN